MELKLKQINSAGPVVLGLAREAISDPILFYRVMKMAELFRPDLERVERVRIATLGRLAALAPDKSKWDFPKDDGGAAFEEFVKTMNGLLEESAEYSVKPLSYGSLIKEPALRVTPEQIIILGVLASGIPDQDPEEARL